MHHVHICLFLVGKKKSEQADLLLCLLLVNESSIDQNHTIQLIKKCIEHSFFFCWLFVSARPMCSTLYAKIYEEVVVLRLPISRHSGSPKLYTPHWKGMNSENGEPRNSDLKQSTFYNIASMLEIINKLQSKCCSSPSVSYKTTMHILIAWTLTMKRKIQNRIIFDI